MKTIMLVFVLVSVIMTQGTICFSDDGKCLVLMSGNNKKDPHHIVEIQDKLYSNLQRNALLTDDILSSSFRASKRSLLIMVGETKDGKVRIHWVIVGGKDGACDSYLGDMTFSVDDSDTNIEKAEGKTVEYCQAMKALGWQP